jgi:hypothetical protein
MSVQPDMHPLVVPADGKYRHAGAVAIEQVVDEV